MKKLFDRETILSAFIGIVLGLLFTTSLVGCYGVYGFDGRDGRDGLNGAQGPQGVPGIGCTTEQLENGALIKCGNNTASVILNGAEGLQGPKGDQGEPGQDLSPGAYGVAYVIDPCGKQSAYDELLLVLNNGQILAHYSDGGKQFLTIIGPGNYRTTDGNNCNFRVDQNLNVTW